jgi:hypothetical protein
MVAALVGLSVAVVPAAVSAQKAPEFKQVLAGKKVEPPFKGQAEVEFTSTSKKNGDNVVTTMRVKNMASAPLARLKVAETWFDKAGNVVVSSEGTLDKPLPAGGVDTLTITTPWNSKMNGNSWNFSHANGTVKPKKVKAIEDPKAAATKTATTAKK